MILNVTKFKAALRASGMKAEDLAGAVERPGLDALSAVRNWSHGDFRPRPTREDLRKIAAALNVDVNDIVRFDGRHAFARIAPRKVRLVSDMIRGCDIDTALNRLKFSKKRAAVFVRKTLDTAIAQAEEAEADLTRLVVAESRVDAGPVLKRFQPKDRGRAHPIAKRTSHIVIAVEEA